MKKKTFLARVRWGALAMLATGGLLLTSCASDGFNEETFEGSVRNTQLENPSINPSKNIYPTDDKSQTIIEWDVVFGARAYDCKVYDTTENPYVLVKDTVIDGRRFTVPREEDHTYALYIQTLANTTLGNIDAPEPSLIQLLLQRQSPLAQIWLHFSMLTLKTRLMFLLSKKVRKRHTLIWSQEEHTHCLRKL